MAKNSFTSGVVLLIAGFLILLGKLGVLQFLGELFWPVFILLPGLIFHFLYFSRVLPSGVLIPGGILTTYALIFFFCSFFGWDLMKYLWPGFIFGAAVGLYEFQLFDPRHPRGVLLASMILAVLSLILFALMLMFTAAVYIFAFAMIAAGGMLIYRRSHTIW